MSGSTLGNEWLSEKGLIGAIGLVLLVLLGLIGWVFRHEFPLPALALGSVVVLLLALMLFAALMNSFSLSDRTQALGLPAGSVRAIIALALVGMFAVLAASVLTPYPASPRTITGLTQQDINAFLLRNPSVADFVQKSEPKAAGAEQTYTISFATSPKADEFAKQMLTLVGTLMTAVSAFYFGGRSASPGERLPPSPEITGVDNPNRPAGDGSLDLTVAGSNLNNIRSMRLIRQDGTEREGSSVLSNAGQASCKIPFPDANSQIGIWDVTVVDDIGRTATKKGALRITAP